MFKALQCSQDSGCSLNRKKLQNPLLAFRSLDDKLLTGQYFIDMYSLYSHNEGLPLCATWNS